MKRHLVLAGMLALILGLTALAGAAERPNVIVVFIDDMGWGDFSSFGNEDAQTPAIDRMAGEGIAFEQFYVNSPICSPSRVAISTGQYPQRWKITSFLAHRQANARRGMANWLDPDAPMLARILHDAGYATGHFGKWHMGGQRDVDEAPPISAYGFDASLTNFEGMGAKLLPLTMTPDSDEPGRIWEDAEQLGDPVTWMQRSRITGGFVDAAIEFIKQATADGKPFYVNVWPDDVHSPYFPPVDRWGDGKQRTLYLAVLEEMDRQLASLFDCVRTGKALRENTLILICSDNGPARGAGSAGPFKGFKGQLYEGGIRSSLIVWGPGLMPQEAMGTRNRESVVAAIDLPPTLLAVTGAESPKGVRFDGEALPETLLGKAKRSREAPIFFSRPPDRRRFYGVNNLPDLAIRDGKWKLLCDLDGSRAQLYNLAEDPGERNNRAGAHPRRVERMIQQVVEWFRGMPQEVVAALKRPGGGG